MEACAISRISGPRYTFSFREKAPLAALFEDCSQTIKRARDVVINAEPDAEEKTSLRILIERCLGRLTTWGQEAGAASRLLDYTLRRASSPRKVTETLLKDLSERLDNTIEALLSALEAEEVFAELTRGEQHEQRAPSPSAEVAFGQTESLDMVDILGLEDNLAGSGPEKHLEEAQAIIDDLFYLQSVLFDPHDDFDTDPAPLDAVRLELADRGYVHKFFVQAAPFLVQRLLQANRCRRQNMYWSKKTYFAPGCEERTARRTDRAVARSDTGISETTPSTADASSLLFSDLTGETESMTSFTSSISCSSRHSLGVLLPPPPPKDLTRCEVLQLQCPYCYFEIPFDFTNVAPMTHDDWVAHIYMDLQPYICTFEGCRRAHKTFGRKQEWFQHELDYHRTRQVWYCANTGCEAEFETPVLFEEHLKSNHPDVIDQISPGHLETFFKTCRRLSLAPQSSLSLHCVLCGLRYEKPEVEWKDHLAHHLEQFALLAINEDEREEERNYQSVEDSIIHEFLDSLMEEDAEGVPKLVVVSLPKDEPVLSTQSSQKAENNAEHDSTDNMNSTGLDDNGEEGRHRHRSDHLWEYKVESYLEKDARENQVKGNQVEDHSEVAETVRWNIPWRIKDFIGRDNDLRDLEGSISQPGKICVLSGRGGIGKSATAVEYLYRCSRDYSAVFWIEAESPGRLSDKYHSLGADIFDLGTEPGQDALSLAPNIRSALGRLERRWLLVLDNVESWDDIAKYIPRGLPKTKGSVLITTRHQNLIKMNSKDLQRVLHRIELRPLEMEACTRFLIRSLDPRVTPQDLPGHKSYRNAAKIAGLVERLPLAVNMVAGYIKISQTTLEEFLEMWEEKEAFRAKHAERNKIARRNGLANDSGVRTNIHTLLDIGISELSVPARSLLEIVAFFDPDTIQKDLLVGDHNEESFLFLNSPETAQFNRMIRGLHERGLIGIREPKQGSGEEKEESYSIHRILQEKIQLDLDSHGRFDSVMAKAMRLIRKRFPQAPRTHAPVTPPQKDKQLCRKYLPHVLSLLRVFTRAKHMDPGIKRGESEEMANLFYDAGVHVWDSKTTEPHEALALLDAAEAILDSEWVEIESRHPRQADIHRISGLIRRSLGCQERDNSLRRLQLALVIRQHVYDNTYPYDRHADVLLQDAAIDYCTALLDRYEFGEAEDILQRCLSRYRAWGSEDEHPSEYSRYHYNMGVIRLCQGLLGDAIHHLQRSIDLLGGGFGGFGGREGRYWDHYFMLACAIRENGDLGTALNMHQKIRVARLEQLGEHSSATVLSTYAVADMFTHLGDLENAIKYMQRCIDLAMATGWTKQALGRAHLYLSQLYRRHGASLVEAEVLEAKAMETLAENREHVSGWVARLNQPTIRFDDLQPTDQGRYAGTMLLRALWARRNGDKTVTILSPFTGEEITLDTGL